MPRRVKLNEVQNVFGAFQYPATKADVRAGADDIVLVMADGEERLSSVVDRSQASEFLDAHDLRDEVFMHLPIAAVGEPGQSEGTA
jgi:hypothetical protein